MGKFKALRDTIFIILLVVAAIKIYPHLHELKNLQRLKDNIHPVWLVLAVCFQFLQYGSDGWLSKTLLKIINFRLSFKDTLRIASLDVFASHLLPIGRVGSLAAVFYFYKGLGVEPEAIAFQSIIGSIVTTFMLMVLFFCSLILLPRDAIAIPDNVKIIIAFFLGIVALIFFVYGATKHPKAREKLRKLFSRFSWYEVVEGFLRKWKIYKKLFFAKKTLVLQVVIAATFFYVADIATLACSFYAFHVFPSVSLLIFGYTTSLIAGLITLAPAGIGATDATLAFVFLSTKIDPLVAVGAILIFRLFTFWIPIPAGAVSYFSLKKKLAKKGV